MKEKNMFSLEGKVALITGGAYGIGFTISAAFAEAGTKIVFNCLQQEHLEKAIEEYQARGFQCVRCLRRNSGR